MGLGLDHKTALTLTQLNMLLELSHIFLIYKSQLPTSCTHGMSASDTYFFYLLHSSLDPHCAITLSVSAYPLLHPCIT